MTIKYNGYCLASPYREGRQDKVEMHIHPLEEAVGGEEVKENLDREMKINEGFNGKRMARNKLQLM
jgi:hypothetical protein